MAAPAAGIPSSLNSSSVISSALKDIVDALEPSPIVSYLLDADLTITYCNPAWDRFAVENDGAEMVRSRILPYDLRRALPDDLRSYYLHAFETSAKGGSVWDCLYECSSPEVFRKFHMRIHPLQPGGGFLVTNALVLESAHPNPVDSALEKYLTADSTIAMCSHCRRSRQVAHPECWDFVPAHLFRTLSNISHGLCPICLEYFYPRPAEELGV